MPEAFRLTPEDGKLHLHIRGKWSSTSYTLHVVVDDDTRDSAERIETAVSSVLSTVQDEVAENLREPWPSRDGHQMALPGVRLDADALHMWFGDTEESAVLTLPSIAMHVLNRES